MATQAKEERQTLEEKNWRGFVEMAAHSSIQISWNFLKADLGKTRGPGIKNKMRDAGSSFAAAAAAVGCGSLCWHLLRFLDLMVSLCRMFRSRTASFADPWVSHVPEQQVCITEHVAVVSLHHCCTYDMFSGYTANLLVRCGLF